MWLYLKQMQPGMSSTWKSWEFLYLCSNRRANSQKSTKLKKRENCGINTLSAASCVELISVVMSGVFLIRVCTIFKLRSSTSIYTSMLHASDHDSRRSHVFCSDCVAAVARQIQSHMLCVCSANYLQRKEFDSFHKSVFVTLFSSSRWHHLAYHAVYFMTQFLVAEKSFWWSIREHGESSGNQLQKLKGELA